MISRHILRQIKALCILVTVLFSSTVFAASKSEPLWELGIGVAGASLQHYPGSDQRQNLILPVPFAIYRGDVFRASGGGVRAYLIDSDLLELNVSLTGSLRVRTEDNRARENMPDLDYTFEIGPQLAIKLAEDQAAPKTLWLRLPARAAFATDFSDIDHIGWVAAPQFRARFEPSPDWRIFGSLGAQFSTDKFHNYFYGVAPEFDNSLQTPPAAVFRPTYDASGGYTGAFLSAGIYRDWSRWGVGAYSSMWYLKGAEIHDSPLVRSDSSFSMGIVVTYRAFQSKKMVYREEDAAP